MQRAGAWARHHPVACPLQGPADALHAQSRDLEGETPRSRTLHLPASTGQYLLSQGLQGARLLPKNCSPTRRKGNIVMFPQKCSILVARQTQQFSCCAEKIESI